ncbi:MAG: hypothetical protein EHM83_06430 [Burkholderiales bacterium]|nr:MAG: hypothetical protein EHM83_06430 [Burkholderiales bacterium]
MSARYDFYGPIHKGLRLGSARLLTRLGSVDWRDPLASAALLADLRTHLVLSKEHLEHEDAEIIPPLRTHAPELAMRLDQEHSHHDEAFAELEALAVQAESAGPGDREAAGRALHLRFSVYFADDLAHMAREEREALSAFHASFSDAEMLAMEMRIIQSIQPERLTQYYFLMVPGMNPSERAAFLRHVKVNAPPEAYEHLLNDVARAALPQEAFRALNEELALAA